MLVRVLYTSHMRPGVTPSEVRRLVAESQPRNRRLDITGAMLKCDHRFVQAIEGREQDVLQLMARISADHRHSQVTTHVQERTTTRLFDGWAMGYVERLDMLVDLENLDAGALAPEGFFEKLRLVVEEDKISPLRRRP